MSTVLHVTVLYAPVQAPADAVARAGHDPPALQYGATLIILTTFALKMAQATALTVLYMPTVSCVTVLYVPTVLHVTVL